MHVGVGVGRQRRCKACQSLRELDNQLTVSFFFCGHHHGYQVRSCCAGWRTLTPHKGNDSSTRCEYGKASRRQLRSCIRCCLWSGHTRKQRNSLLAVIHRQESRHQVPKSVLRAVLGRMQFTLHATRRTPHGASRMVQAMSAWSTQCLPGWRKPDVLHPGIVGMRGSTVI